MDTKLKNTGNTAFKRTAAFIFAVLFVFISCFGICCFIRDAFFYNESPTGDIPEYIRTNAFRLNMNRFIQTTQIYGEMMSCKTQEDYYKTSEGKLRLKEFTAKSAEIRAACDYLDSVENLEVSVTRDNFYRYHYFNGTGDYYYTFNGELISKADYEEYEFVDNIRFTAMSDETRGEEDVSVTSSAHPDSVKESSVEDVSNSVQAETHPAEPATEMTTVTLRTDNKSSGGIKFTKNTVDNIKDAIGTVWNITETHGKGINYGEMPTDDIISEYKKAMLPELETDFYEFNLVTEKMPSVKYAVFYKSTGNVISNCGVKFDDDTETVLSKFGNTVYYEYKTGDKYTSSADTAENSFKELFDYGESYLKNENDSSVERAYFAVTSSAAPQNLLFTGETAYKSNLKVSKIASGSAFLGISIISFILACVSSVYLMLKAGISNNGEAEIRAADKIPFLLRLGFAGAVTAVCAVLFVGINYYEFYLFYLFTYKRFPHSFADMIASAPSVICAFLGTAAFICVTALICSFIRNIRTKTFLRYTLTGLVFRAVRKVFRAVKGLASKIREKASKSYSENFATEKGKKFLIRSGIIILLFDIAATAVLVAADAYEEAIVIGIIAVILLGLYAVLLAVSYNKIAIGISKIKGGNFETVINKKLMPPYMKATAADISGVRDGIRAAADKAVKEQATRTELLTNVTHDLKTPLTSIINYVDLLKKTDDPAEQAEYLNILDEKSQRLKKLIDDLVQASKAASGNVDINAEKLDLCEFASQIIGENEDELNDEGIELILKLPPEHVYVSADRNITNRIFENLLSNIRKYALKGTRAYIEVASGERFGLISFKNISALPLEADAERFTERFYRGDASRTGEGNGLGLSIAGNLCAAQGGVLKIETDGDLFKVKVTIPKADTLGKEE